MSFPEGAHTSDLLILSGNLEVIEIPMEVFIEYTKIPIIIYFGDNLPETDEHPEQYEWTIRLRLVKQWVETVNS